MSYILKYMNVQSRCLQCGKILSPNGRPDRKFCCRECKNQWHNRRTHNPLKNEVESAVLRTLSNNHAILDRLYRVGVRNIDLAALYQMGFDSHFMTSCIHLGRRTVVSVFDLQYELTPTRIKRLSCLSETKSEE